MSFKRRPPLKVPPSSRPKAVLKSTPSAATRVPPPVERHVVPRGPAVAPHFRMADFPMILPGLPSSIVSSPATTLAPATPTSKAPSGQLPSAATTPKPMGPPPAQRAAPKPKAPSKEQVQVEGDTIVREAEEKRAKRTSDEQQLHDAMLAAIFKAIFEDTVPESYAGIYSSGRKRAWAVRCQMSSSSALCRRMFRMTSCVRRFSRRCGPATGSQATSVCSTTAS